MGITKRDCCGEKHIGTYKQPKYGVVQTQLYRKEAEKTSRTSKKISKCHG
jgi:hypothetical protein